MYIGRYNQVLCTSRLQTPITGAAITFELKKNLNPDESAIFQLQNAGAGGGPDEIEDIDLSIGTIRLKIQETMVADLDAGWYWGEAKAVISGEPYLLFQTQVKLEKVVI